MKSPEQSYKWYEVVNRHRRDTSSRDCESAMVTMYSEGPTKARQRLSLLTARASGARSVPRATALPSQSGKNESNNSAEYDIV